MSFVANFIGFPAKCKTFENLLRFDKFIDSLKVGAFLRHNVDTKNVYHRKM